MTIPTETIWAAILALAGGGVGAYVAIRSDLAALHEKVNAAHDQLEFVRGHVFKGRT